MSKATKNDLVEGKPDLSLLPLDILEEVARAYEYGLVKYQRNDWRGGFETHRSIAAALRHISAWNDQGEKYDKEAFERTGKNVHHLGMAVFNLLCALQTEGTKPDLVDNYKPSVEVEKCP